MTIKSIVLSIVSKLWLAIKILKPYTKKTLWLYCNKKHLSNTLTDSKSKNFLLIKKF